MKDVETMTRTLPDLLIEPVVRMALAEDLGRVGDVTAQACIPEDARFSAVFSARQAGVMAGGAVVRIAIHAMDPSATVTIKVADGEAFAAGTVLVEAEADARALLAAERTALNLLGRMCGIATLTRTYVQAVAGTRARIADTRKTTPGLRALEKYAVRCGGGFNHRFGLDDAILIKDNHIAAAGGVAPALRAARAAASHMTRVEIEVDRLDQLAEVLETGGADVVLLDNMDDATLAEAVALVGGRLVTEASGNMTLARLPGVAATGVDYISCGALTHSARTLDLGLDF